jgi:prepilin-type N-terminal cleavage/methylation domain-containing protein
MNRKHGFTLVELSIVLVIIGLFIGGVLVAQSMIQTAKIQAQVRQLGQFDAAVANFRAKYNALPGDNLLFGNTGVTVDGNILNSIGSYSFDGEIGRFWYDLSLNGLVNPGGSNYADASVAGQVVNPGVNLPKSILGKNGSIIAYHWTDPGNYYQIATHSGFGAIAPTLTAIEAQAVDTKIDDGIPNNGQVIGLNFGVCDVLVSTPAPPHMVYDFSTSGTICYLTVRIGLTTGYLQ